MSQSEKDNFEILKPPLICEIYHFAQIQDEYFTQIEFLLLSFSYDLP